MVILKLASVVVLATVSLAQLTYDSPDLVRDYVQSSYSLIPEPRNDPSSPLVLDFQPPRVEAPRPFYSPEPANELRPPSADSPIGNFEDFKGAPSEDLALPSADQWNPNNDPAYFYPVEKLTQNVPTAVFPKKYNKNAEKLKPSTLKTKEMLANLEKVIEQHKFDKIVNALEKQENRKALQEEEEERKVKEPEVAESGFNGFALETAAHSHGLSQNGDRMEFQMHGHDGPYSYKWGYDTGKGHNRQFRYEERDKRGHVKGHYGFHDKSGKLRVVHYEADPHEGFHAEGNFGHA